MMHLSFHIGKCCGIKTIWGMGLQPGGMEPALQAEVAASHDRFGNAVETYMRFYHLKAPQEAKLERLDRYLNFVKKCRPRHVVEIVLAESVHPHVDQSAWVPELETRGFRLVNSCENSNSGSIIHIYHLNVGE